MTELFERLRKYLRTNISGGNALKYLLALLVLFNIADAVLTRFLLRLALATEGNPFLQPIVDQPSFILVKVLGVCLCVLILWDISRRHPRLAFLATFCFVMFYAMVVLWNTSLLLG